MAPRARKYPMDYEGDGLLTDIYKKVTGRSPGEKDINSLIQKHGQAHVTGIMIGRQVVSKTANNLMNLVSLGKFQAAKESYDYDKLFHLWLTIRLDDGYSFRIEKRPQVSVSSPVVPGEKETMDVDMRGTRPELADFIERTQNMMGVTFYNYDYRSTNCQDFCEKLLKANGLLSSQNRAFIQQDMQKTLAKEMPEASSKLAMLVTDVASVVHDVTGTGVGRGRSQKTIPLSELLQGGSGFMDIALGAAKTAAKAVVNAGSDAVGSHIGRAAGDAAGRRITQKYTKTGGRVALQAQAGGHLIEHKGGSFRTRESKTHTQPISVVLTPGQITKLQGSASASAGLVNVTITKPRGRTNSVVMVTKRDANKVSKAWAQGKGVRVSVLV